MKQLLNVDMITARGHHVDYMAPEALIVDPADLNIHTSNMCRYNGALDWKLAQHLLLCGYLVEDLWNPKHSKQDQLIQRGYAVAHDFQEIYCTDLVSGLKKYLPDYREIEDKFEHHVHAKLGLSLEYRNTAFIKFIDLRALVVEMTFLNHPAATKVASQFGGPMSQIELKAIQTVQDTPPEHRWLQIQDYYQQAARAIKELPPIRYTKGI